VSARDSQPRAALGAVFATPESPISIAQVMGAGFARHCNLQGAERLLSDFRQDIAELRLRECAIGVVPCSPSRNPAWSTPRCALPFGAFALALEALVTYEVTVT
jgi:hypothetical protein